MVVVASYIEAYGAMLLMGLPLDVAPHWVERPVGGRQRVRSIGELSIAVGRAIRLSPVARVRLEQPEERT